MFFDVHAHLDDEAFDEDRKEVIKDIQNAGICVINAGSDIASSEFSLDLADRYDFIYACIGIHPHEAKDVPVDYLDILRDLSKHKKVVAIGEIGLDYYYDLSDKEDQKKVFMEQLGLAKELDLPVVIHDREAHQDTLDIVKASGVKKGLMHCYSGSYEMALEFIKLGFYFSFGGIITFKNAKKPKEVVAKLPLESILCETDCPYLTPEPYRGRRNDPTKIPIIAQKIAELRDMDFHGLEMALEQNTRNLFFK
ncbi:MAG TPA: TatD family hydrolase [Thermoanaerobacterales bacterium]|jgi:TatD DNase family protein|nr:TatD family hydrolase [Thermoanaerobacterales bacterium]